MPKKTALLKEWPTLSVTDSQKLRADFEAANTNRDQWLDRSELLEMLKQNTNTSNLDDEKLGKMVDEVIKFGDRNGDGKISFREFMKLSSMDSDLRFEVSFVRTLKRRAQDYLGLALYVPFVVLFTFFLVTGKDVGTAFPQVSNILVCIEYTEFGKTNVTNAKFFPDIDSDSALFDWLLGPVLGAFWAGDETETARGHVMGSPPQNNAIGALKIRQKRAKALDCGERFNKLVEFRSDTLKPDFYLQRRREFDNTCYTRNDGITTSDN